MPTLNDIDGGRVYGATITATELTVYEGMRIDADGVLQTAASTGAHVREWSISGDGAQCSVTYYMPNAAGSLCTAYYDESGTLLGGIPSGGSGGGTILTTSVSLPLGTRKVRVFSIRSGQISAEAALTITSARAVYEMVEIAYGSNLEIVWPTTYTYRITSATVRYYNRDGVLQNRSYFTATTVANTDYAVAIGTVEVIRGQTVVQTLTNVELTALDFNEAVPTIVLNNDTRPQFSIISGRVRASYLARNTIPRREVGVRWGYLSAEPFVASVAQQANQQSGGTPTVTYGDLSFSLMATDFESTGGSTTGSANISYTRVQPINWTSGASGSETTSGILTDITPSIASISGMTVNWPNFTFAPNTGATDKDYNVTATYQGKSASVAVSVHASSAAQVSYSNLQVTSYEYASQSDPATGATFHIPASGNSGAPLYPTIAFSIRRTQGGSSVTLTGTASGGQTVATAYAGSYSVPITITYLQGGSADSNYGAAEAGSREANIDTSTTTVRSGLSVRLSYGSSLTANSSTRTVVQQQNRKTSDGTFHVTAFTVTPTVGGTAMTSPYTTSAASKTITLDIRASGSGTTPTYTSGWGGTNDSIDNQPVSPETLTVKVGNTPVAVSNKQFTATNAHTLTDKTYTVYAKYVDGEATIQITQLKDEKVPGPSSPYVSLALVANALTAAGGTLDLIGTAYSTSGLVWESDQQPVSGESTTIDNTGQLTLEFVESTAGAFPQASVISTDTTNHTKTWRITHRDMANNAVTDTISSIYAKNGESQTASPLSYSVTNQLEATEYPEEGTVSWGGSYPLAIEYMASLTIQDYTNQNQPASISGASTPYSASASHKTQDFHDGVVPVNYYRRYTSWTAATDDQYHRALSRTEYDTETYYRQPIAGTVRVVTGDTVTVTSSQSWARASGGRIVIDPQGDNGARSATITATNASDPATVKAKAEADIYQAAYVALSTSGESFVFEPSGGEETFTVTWIRTAYAITHSGQGNDDPVSYLVPTSGGSVNGRNTDTITFRTSPNYTDNPMFGEIKISPVPTNDDLEPLYIDVLVKTNTPHHDLTATVMCSWIAANRISYMVAIQNDRAYDVTLSNVLLAIYSTPTPAHPEAGQMENYINLGTVTAAGGDLTIVASGEMNLTRNTSRTYWSYLSNDNVYSEYWPFEEETNE